PEKTMPLLMNDPFIFGSIREDMDNDVCYPGCLLLIEECLQFLLQKQEPKVPPSLGKFNGNPTMGPACPVDTMLFQRVQTRTVTCPNGYFAKKINSI
ncbi:hypothetical protein STEG23_002513, partial [Scotinomys teguina]